MEQIQSNLPGYRNNRSTFPDGVYRSQSMPGETCGRKCILERMLERRRKEKEGVLPPKSEGSAAAIRRARRSHGIIIRRICMHDFEVAFTRLRPTQRRNPRFSTDKRAVLLMRIFPMRVNLDRGHGPGKKFRFHSNFHRIYTYKVFTLELVDTIDDKSATFQGKLKFVRKVGR